MEAHEDWCFFEKIGVKEIGLSDPYSYSCQLVSANNTHGWVFFAKSQELQIIQSKDLISCFKSNTSTIKVDFDKDITHISSDQIGKTIAIACGNELHLLSFTQAIKGMKHEKVHICNSLIKALAWNNDRISVLTADGILEIFKSSSKECEKQPVKAFGFVDYNTGISCEEKNILVVSLPDFTVYNQINCDIWPIGVSLIRSDIMIYGIRDQRITLGIFTKDLVPIKELESIESFPYTVHPSLAGNLEDLLLVSYLEAINTRHTLLFSSSCSVSIDVLVFDSQYVITNFEENMDGQCKIGYHANFEGVLRGFCVVDSYEDPEAVYSYNTKDTTYSIALPPLVLYIGSDGKLILSRFIDLRREYLNDKVCKKPLSIGEIPDVKVENHFLPIGKQNNNEIATKNIPNLSQASAKPDGFLVKAPDPNQSNPFTAKPNEADQKTLFSIKINESNLPNPFLKKPDEGLSTKTNQPNPFFTKTNEGLSTKNNEPNPFFIKPNETDLKSSIFNPSKTGPTPLNPSGASIKQSGGSLFPNTTKLSEGFGLPKDLGSLSVSEPPNPSEALKKFENPGFFLSGQAKKNENVTISAPLGPASGSFFANTKKSEPVVPNTGLATTLNNPFIASSKNDPQKDLQSLSTPFKDSSAAEIPKSPTKDPKKDFLSLSTPETQKKTDNPQLSFKFPENQSNRLISEKKVNENISDQELNQNILDKQAKLNLIDKPATVYSNKIKEQDDIMNLLFKDIKESITQIESLRLPDSFYKEINSRCIYYREKLNKITDGYLEKVEDINLLYENLDEINMGMEFIYKSVDIQKKSTENDSLDIHFIKSVGETDKSIKILQKYIENGIDKVVENYKTVTKYFGATGKALNTNMKFKKTRSYCPETELKPTTPLVSNVFIENKIKSIKVDLEKLEKKASSLTKTLRKKQQKVYNFNIQENEEDIQPVNVTIDYTDPAELKKIFKSYFKAKK
jgi:hypothetical protein